MENRQPYRRGDQQPVGVCDLEGLRAISGGIAHDCISLMNAITGNLNQAMGQPRSDNRIDPILQEVRCAANTARDLAEKLADFSNGKARCNTPVAVLPLVEKTVGYCLSDCPGIRCRYAIQKHDCTIAMDRRFFSQALFNVITNATEAMPGGGCLTISLDLPQPHPSLPSLADTHCAALTIQDQGMGISPEHLNRIFTPYFSAWPAAHKKLGLGLSISRAIIRHYNGDITVASRPGAGTTVCMYLPF